MGVSKRLYMGVSTHTYDDVLTHLHTCVLQRRPLIVAERQHIAHGKPDRDKSFTDRTTNRHNDRRTYGG